MTFDRLLVAVGRRPLTRGLGLEDLGVDTDPKTGQILVDETYRTSVAGIYAIGDLVPGPMLAHKASAEGTAAVECMAGRAGEVNYDTIPAVVYTWPEVASVGLTEEQVREKQIPYCVGSFPFPAPGGPAAWARPTASSSSSPTAKTDRHPGRPHHRPPGRGHDRRMCAGHGVRRQQRRHRPHHSRPPHLRRSPAGGGHECAGSARSTPPDSFPCAKRPSPGASPASGASRTMSARWKTT
jgi:hypothetical protein